MTESRGHHRDIGGAATPPAIDRRGRVRCDVDRIVDPDRDVFDEVSERGQHVPETTARITAGHGAWQVRPGFYGERKYPATDLRVRGEEWPVPHHRWPRSIGWGRPSGRTEDEMIQNANFSFDDVGGRLRRNSTRRRSSSPPTRSTPDSPRSTNAPRASRACSSRSPGIRERRQWPDGVSVHRRRCRRRREGDRRIRHRSFRDRPDGRHERLPRTARAVERRHRARRARPADHVPELRPLQRMPRLRQRDASRRRDDRLGPDRLRTDRRRRGHQPGLRQHDQLPQRARHRHRGHLRQLRHAHARLGRRRDGARSPLRQPRQPSDAEGLLPGSHPAPRAVRRVARGHDHRHQGAARRRHRARQARVGRRRCRRSRGAVATATSSTRSPKCTRTPCSTCSTSKPTTVPKTFPFYGNIGPAAIPITLAHVQDTLAVGDSVVCMGIGSGLNAGVIELRW